MIIEGNHIIADEGKILRRIVSNEIYGQDIWLGKSYYIGGVLQNPPHDDVPEDFEEIYEDAEVSDTEALEIITANEEE